ncbi:MAG TPA: hypothetical protein VII01_10285 [Solirubrobacteraceae bacterium]|jgi:hypothetical protein
MQSPERADARGPLRAVRAALGRLSLAAWAALAALIALAVISVVVFGGGGSSPTREQAPRAGTEAAPKPASGRPLPRCGVECDPIDIRYLTDVPFGRTSFWIQPWRAYLDTWPAARLRDAMGINFNVATPRADAVAHLLHDSGFGLARMEIEWSALSYSDPAHFVKEASILSRFRALRRWGLRPLLVLNANSGGPCPARSIALHTIAPAVAGSSSVRLSPASAAAVASGRTGFNAGAFFTPVRRRRHRGVPGAALARLTPAQRRARRLASRALRRAAIRAGRTPLLLHGTPDIIITHVATDGVATLSHPLPTALAAGTHPGTRLLYAPFSAPRLADGRPNPAFAETLHGWLDYTGQVSRLAASVFGPDGYDLEVWNELTFGSQFLNAEDYSLISGRAAKRASKQVTREVTKEILDATVAYARSAASHIGRGVGITDGFASETPFPSGASSPAGLTALSKHPYVGARSFPAEYHVNALHPVNALGLRDTETKRSTTPAFIPSFQSLLPEYTLTATSTETLIRDLAPLTTRIYGFPHGRSVGPGRTPVQKWITEYNLGSSATPVGPDGHTPETGAALSQADRDHFHAKALLRSLVAMVSKGVSREYFFAAGPGALSLISPGFFAALETRPGSYPGDRAGGAIMAAFRALLEAARGPGPGRQTRRLRLLSIRQLGDHAQFAGDGTPAHPPLYDRDVLAVFPFQTAPRRFVVPVYVMTRDLLTLYRPDAPAADVARFDLPPERFRVTLAGLPPSSSAPSLSAFDPLSARTTAVRLISHRGEEAVVEIEATDYPRLLSIVVP